MMRPLASAAPATSRARSSTTRRRSTQATATASSPRPPPITQQQPPLDAETATAAPTPTPRRSVLLAAALSATTTIACPRPAAAAGLFFGTNTVEIPVPAAAGWRLTPPPGWTLAYDRTPTPDDGTAAMKNGPKVMWANFATLGTIVVSRATREEARWPQQQGDAKDDNDEASVVALADALLAEARDSPATYGWRVLAATSHTTAGPSPSSPPVRVYDVEYVQQICRGEVLEAAGGNKRCANPRDDSDLQVVSRHFLMSFCLDPVEEDVVWVVRGSCPSENWPQAGPRIAEAMRTLTFSAAA